MIDPLEFRKLADASTGSLTGVASPDLPTLYAHFGLPKGTSWSTQEALKVLRLRIRQELAFVGDGITWRSMRNFKEQLVRQYIIEAMPLHPYLEIVELLHEELRQVKPGESFRPLSDADNWRRALDAVGDHISISQIASGPDRTRLALIYPRVLWTSEEAAWLKSQGHTSIKPVDGHIEIDPMDLKQAAKKLEDAVRSYGGLNLIIDVLGALSPYFDSDQERLQLGRRTETIPKGLRPELPIGYLLNLSMKPSNFQGGSRSNETREFILKYSTAIAAIYNVQPYTLFELEYKTLDGLSEFLREIVLFDSLFTLNQLRPRDLPLLLEGLFDWVDATSLQKAAGWTIADAVSITRGLLGMAPLQRTVGFNKISLATAVPSLQAPIREALLTDLTHAVPDPNGTFSTPEDIASLTFFRRPLTEENGNYWMVDAPWCAPAFFEAIATVVRDRVSKQADDQIGLAAERFLRTQLTKAGVSHSTGKYTQGGQDGECDLVVETSDTVIFFELKKKALTRAAKSGNDVNLLLDIADSLMAAQLQLGQHELLLRQTGYLELDNAGTVTKLELRGREIERVAVTLLDYGGLQDRRVLAQLLSLVLNAQFSPKDLKFQKKFEALNAKCRELQSQAVELQKVGGWHSIPFFNCWFLSVPQLLVLLDNVSCNDDLKKELWETRHMSMGTLDFNRDLAFMRKMRQRAAQQTGS